MVVTGVVVSEFYRLPKSVTGCKKNRVNGFPKTKSFQFSTRTLLECVQKEGNTDVEYWDKRNNLFQKTLYKGVFVFANICQYNRLTGYVCGW